MRYQLVLLIGLALIAIGLGLLMCVLAQCFPEDRENRPAPPDVVVNREASRTAALKRIAARQDDVDIARRDQPRQPPTRRDVEMRREGQRLSRGW